MQFVRTECVQASLFAELAAAEADDGSVAALNRRAVEAKKKELYEHQLSLDGVNMGTIAGTAIEFAIEYALNGNNLPSGVKKLYSQISKIPASSAHTRDLMRIMKQATDVLRTPRRADSQSPRRDASADPCRPRGHWRGVRGTRLPCQATTGAGNRRFSRTILSWIGGYVFLFRILLSY